MDDDWKQLQRELKILRAKQASGGWLHPKDKARLQWLEERLGDAEAVVRHQVQEPVATGPTVKTSDDHYATEISEQLLQEAEQQKLTKAWEQEQLGRQKKVIEVHDAREKAQATFRQQGLSNFAVEVTDDLKEGEVGLAEVPREEDEGAQKIDYHKAVYAQDESERLLKKEGKNNNPFALNIADSLDLGLDQAAAAESLVPDIGSKGIEVELEDETILEKPTLSYNEADPEARKLLEELGKTPGGLPADESIGAKTTHRAEAAEQARLDRELLQQAVDYAEDQGLVEEEHVWATDDEGREIELAREGNDLDQAVLAPQQPLPESRPRWSDVADTRPGVAAANDPAGDTIEVDLLAAAVQAEASLVGTGTAAPPPPAAAEPSPGVLVPDPPGPGNEENDEGPLIPEPPPESAPEPDDSGPPEVIVLDKPEEETEVMDVEDAMIREVSPEDVPDLSDESIDLIKDPKLAGPVEAQQVAADDFWGLSGEATETVPEPAQPTLKQPAPPPPDRPVPPAPEPSAGPLPALSAVPVAPSKKHKAKPRARVSIEKKSPSHPPRSLMSLFDDNAADQEDGLVPSGSSLDQPFSPAPASPQQRSKKGVANDLVGPRRATVHFKDGVNRRGVINQVDTDADLVRLEPAPGSAGEAEEIVALAVKAIFLMLPRGTAYPDKQGMMVKLVMMDGRRLEGFTPDYDPHRKAFTMFPARDSGNIERVIVYNDAVKNIWFE